MKNITNPPPIKTKYLKVLRWRYHEDLYLNKTYRIEDQNFQGVIYTYISAFLRLKRPKERGNERHATFCCLFQTLVEN